VQLLLPRLLGSLSLRIQMRWVFKSTYLCCCEVAGTAGFLLEPLEHPSIVIVNAAATLLALTGAGNVTLRTLTEWASSNSPSVPLVTPEDACALSRDVVVQTIQYFANRPHDNAERYDIYLLQGKFHGRRRASKSPRMATARCSDAVTTTCR
jgi:hypothetical protein